MKLEIITGAFLGALILASLVTSSIMPLFLGVLLAGGGYYLYRGQQEREGPSSARPAKGASVSFDDIGGNLQAKRELKEALDFLCRSENAKELGIRPLKGVMLTGAPGTGKTMLAKAAAAYSDSLFYTAAGSQFIEMYAGVGAKRVRGLFSAARRDMKGSGKKSAVIFIDEIEVLGGKRGSHSSHLEYDQTLNQLLVEMDGMKSGEGHILVMGATNRLDLLDSALLRPGRFDRVVKVDLPDKESRGMILAIHTANKPLAGDVDLDELAGQTFGFSGAQLESLCNEAAIYALREGCREISDGHFKSACEKVMIGEKAEKNPSPEEKYRIACHEAGHAVISDFCRSGSVDFLTVVPRGDALGYMRQSPQKDCYLHTKQDLEEQIMTVLGGAAAEELLLGAGSSGGANDFEKAGELAKMMIDFGLSSLGPGLGRFLPEKELAGEVKAILEAARKKTEDVLRQKRQPLLELARELAQKESLSQGEIKKLLAS